MDNFRDEKGHLLPGHPGFKPKGAKSELRKKVQEFLAEKWEELPEYFNELKRPKDKLLFLVELLPYCIPRLKQIEADIQVSTLERASIDYSTLSESTLKELLSATTINDASPNT